jgi:predicted flap endonuclease-1-like 5' DNA nuclease
MTPTELRALLFLAFVAVVGAGARLVSSPERPVAEPAERRALRAQMAAVDSARERAASGRGRRVGRGSRSSSRSSSRSGSPAPAPPPPPAFPVDVDRADSAALDALPGIGPALARRIVEERHKCGPYGSLRALERVRGIGPALSKRLAPKVTFSLPRRPSSAVDGCGAGPPKVGPRRRAGDRS